MGLGTPVWTLPLPQWQRLHSRCKSHGEWGCTWEQTSAVASNCTSSQHICIPLCPAPEKTRVRLISKCLDGAVKIINVIKSPPSSAHFTTLSDETRQRHRKALPMHTEVQCRPERTQLWKRLT